MKGAELLAEYGKYIDSQKQEEPVDEPDEPTSPPPPAPPPKP